MKKILSILTICLMSCFLVGNKVSVAKTEDVPTIEKEETKERVIELNNEESNETDEYYTESWLNILNRYSVETIQKWYLMHEVMLRKNPEEPKRINMLEALSDEMKEELVNDFLNTYFANDIEIQNKIKQLPLDYQYILLEELKTGEYVDNWLNILNRYSVETIQNWYLMPVVITRYPIPTLRLEPLVYCSDEMKEELVNNFLNTYFADDIEIQNKIKQFPLDYQYVLFEKLRAELENKGVI